MNVRFVLSDIDDKELRDDSVYDVFEPTLKLQIQDRDVFDDVGIDSVRKVVVMHFMESALKITQRMIIDLTHPDGEYKYWFLGTGYGLRVIRRGDVLKLSFEMNPKMGPVSKSNLLSATQVLGEVRVEDWVQAIISLSKQLNDRIGEANPGFKSFLASQEKGRAALESWVNTLPSERP